MVERRPNVRSMFMILPLFRACEGTQSGRSMQQRWQGGSDFCFAAELGEIIQRNEGSCVTI